MDEIERRTRTLKRGGGALALGGLTLCAVACAAPFVIGAGALATFADLEIVGAATLLVGVVMLLAVRLLRRRACGEEASRGC